MRGGEEPRERLHEPANQTLLGVRHARGGHGRRAKEGGVQRRGIGEGSTEQGGGRVARVSGDEQRFTAEEACIADGSDGEVRGGQQSVDLLAEVAEDEAERGVAANIVGSEVVVEERRLQRVRRVSDRRGVQAVARDVVAVVEAVERDVVEVVARGESDGDGRRRGRGGKGRRRRRGARGSHGGWW